jgi:hypothetical protein
MWESTNSLQPLPLPWPEKSAAKSWRCGPQVVTWTRSVPEREMQVGRGGMVWILYISRGIWWWRR